MQYRRGGVLLWLDNITAEEAAAALTKLQQIKAD